MELKAALGWGRIKQMVWGAGQHIIDKRTVWELMEWMDEQHIAWWGWFGIQESSLEKYEYYLNQAKGENAPFLELLWGFRSNNFLLAQRLSGFAGIRNWCPCPWNVGVEVSDELLWWERNASHYQIDDENGLVSVSFYTFWVTHCDKLIG